MPKNKFRDSRAKRELRRQIARRLEVFAKSHQLLGGLNYCGMPSVEFLDVLAWKEQLRSIYAVEIDESNLVDMRIQWDALGLKIPIRFIRDDILNFLENTNDIFDLYNLDFYGGFVNPQGDGESRCVNAIRRLIQRQAARKTSFVLIATFNARDKGAKEYLDFLDGVPKALDGWLNVEECCKAHERNNYTRLKLCFPYFCWQYGTTNGFSVQFSDPVVYTSSATMLNFYAEFEYQTTALPAPTTLDGLAELANRPLIRITDSMVKTVDLRPPTVTRKS